MAKRSKSGSGQAPLSVVGFSALDMEGRNGAAEEREGEEANETGRRSLRENEGPPGFVTRRARRAARRKGSRVDGDIVLYWSQDHCATVKVAVLLSDDQNPSVHSHDDSLTVTTQNYL